MLNWKPRNEVGCLKTGDIIEVPSKIPYTKIIVPVVFHYGVVSNICGVPYITHIPWGNKPIFESLERFEKVRRVTRVLRDQQTERLNDKDIVNGYYQYKDNVYNFFDFNCEDYVSNVCKKNIGFDQRRGYLIGFLIILLIILLIYNLTRK